MQSLWALAVAHKHCQAHNQCYNANSGNTRIHPNMLLFSFKTQQMVWVWESHFHSWLQAKTQSQEVFMAFNALSKTLPLPPTWSKSRSAYPVYLQFSGSWWSRTYHATYDFMYQMITMTIWLTMDFNTQMQRETYICKGQLYWPSQVSDKCCKHCTHSTARSSSWDDSQYATKTLVMIKAFVLGVCKHSHNRTKHFNLEKSDQRRNLLAKW